MLGNNVNDTDGAVVDCCVGRTVGASVGKPLGAMEMGRSDGITEAKAVGGPVGISVGTSEAEVERALKGDSDGL
jgi:hypothetical protein